MTSRASPVLGAYRMGSLLSFCREDPICDKPTHLTRQLRKCQSSKSYGHGGVTTEAPPHLTSIHP